MIDDIDVSNLIAQSFLEQIPVKPAVPAELSYSEDRIKDIYRKVGLVLSRYRSGKIPKAFKVIPSLKNWEEILELTEPDKWTPHAVAYAVKIFMAVLPQAHCETFLKRVLLARVEEELSTNKELDVHTYESVKASIRHASAFYKAIVLPICSGADFTLKKAAILASILRKCTIPAMPSAAALIMLSRMPFTCQRALIIKTLLDKNYSLPEKTFESIIRHFSTNRTSQVVYYQTLLTFVTRYYNSVDSVQREEIKRIAYSLKQHPELSPAIFEKLK